MKSGSADVFTHGPLGATRVDSGSGDLIPRARRRRRRAADRLGRRPGVEHLHGDARIKSGSGDVQVKRVRRHLVVSTGSGDVRIESAAASVAIKTGSGDVQVGDAADDLVCTTGSGDLVVDVARQAAGSRPRAPAATSASASRRARPVWTDITTVAAASSSDLTPVGEPAEGQDHLEVRATTASWRHHPPAALRHEGAQPCTQSFTEIELIARHHIAERVRHSPRAPKRR